MYRARLLEGGVPEADVDAIEEGARAAIAEAEAFARAQPEPDVAVLETQVWADGGSAWRN